MRQDSATLTRDPFLYPNLDNGSFRDECLNETLFSSLLQARDQITKWKEDYNAERPHSSLGNITPNEFAAKTALQKQAA